MEKVKVSLFKELYYWTYFYSKKIRENPPWELRHTSFMILLLLRAINFISVYLLIFYIFRELGWDILEVIMHNIDKSDFLIMWMILGFILFGLDRFLFYKNGNKIIAICEQFSKKRRIIGQIKYWVYVALTLLSPWYIANLLDSMR